MKKRLLITLLVTFVLTAGLVQSQQLTIQIEPAKSVVLTNADVESLPHIKVTTGAAESQAVFTGVSMKALLEKAGVTFGETLRGKRLASCLLVEASDDYRVVFALSEFDPAFADKQILLAFERNGKPLDAKEGPYRIVVPDEKRMARWVRQVTALRIVEVR